MVACSSEPVLVSLEGDLDGTAAEEKAVEPYAKPAGVFVDVAYLGGRLWREAQGEVELQMGQIQRKVEHERDGVEFELDRGRVWVVEGEIQMLRVELPYAMRRSQALESIGLPAQVREWFGNRRDWVTRHSAGFDRIRMGREEADSELVLWVEARKFNGRRR